jgi:lysophospholipase L1-like esterase
MLRSPHLRTLLVALAAVPGLVLAAPALSSATPATVPGSPVAVPARPVAPAAAPVRIMPLGDSITGSPGCWRSMLWNDLQRSGHTDIDFVGTLGPQGCGQPHDGDNEGHGGFLATSVANQDQLSGWLAATRPDIVLMHFGTNDVWSNIAPATITAAFSRLVDQMRASNPAMRVIVAKIIPMAPASCAECGQRVVAFNAAIGTWAAQKTTAQSPIVVVDQWSGFSPASDTYDGVHPNDAGNRKIADRWYPALTAVLDGVTPTPPPTTAPPTTAPPTTTPPTTAPPTTAPPTTTPPTPGPTGPIPTLACTASVTLVGQWQGGFQGEVRVSNTGPSTLRGWTVRFTFANGQQITQSWNAALTQSGATVTAGNVGWNGTLTPTASTSFGFIGSATGATTLPSATCIPA